MNEQHEFCLWHTQLEDIKKLKAQFGEEVNEGADEQTLAFFCYEVINTIGVDLIEEHKDVLRKVNGLEWNGFILYGVDEKYLPIPPQQHINGLLENNLSWYDVPDLKRYLFIGDSSISWYVIELKTGYYLELDKPSGEIVNQFSAFSEMVAQIFSDALA